MDAGRCHGLVFYLVGLCLATTPILKVYDYRMGPTTNENPDDIFVGFIDLLVLSPRRDESEVASGELMAL